MWRSQASTPPRVETRERTDLVPPHQQQGSRGKNEPLRHVAKTEQDRQKPSERLRVAQAQARRDAMRRGGSPVPVALDPDDDTPIMETR